jgi:hypothetical protein
MELNKFLSGLKQTMNDVGFVVVVRTGELKLSPEQVANYGRDIGADVNLVMLPSVDQLNNTLKQPNQEIWDVPVETVASIVQNLQDVAYPYYVNHLIGE